MDIFYDKHNWTQIVLRIPVSSTDVATLLSVAVLTVVLNSLVITTIWKDPFKNLKGIANYLILNLAVSDLLVGIPAELLSALQHWYPNERIIQATDITLTLGFYASGLTIAWLAVERLIVISYPLKSTDYLTQTNLTLGILCIWLFAGLLAFLPVLTEWERGSTSRYRIIIFDSLGGLILTLTVACYARIVFLVRKGLYRYLTTEAGREERQSLTENAQEREKIKRRERSVASTVFILAGLLAVCWTPALVLENIGEFCGGSFIPANTLTILLHIDGIKYLHPLANPITYSLCTRKFRRALWRIIMQK